MLKLDKDLRASYVHLPWHLSIQFQKSMPGYSPHKSPSASLPLSGLALFSLPIIEKALFIG